MKLAYRKFLQHQHNETLKIQWNMIDNKDEGNRKSHHRQLSIRDHTIISNNNF